MTNFNSNTDRVRNKNSDAIVYRHSDGVEVITLERFLADAPKNTAEMFALLKRESDSIYKAEDDAQRECGENELPIYDWSEKCATPSLESELCGEDMDEHQSYNKRPEQLLALLPKVKDKLTETQLRRLLQHRRDGLTTRQIAEVEGCTQNAIVQSLNAADKKI